MMPGRPVSIALFLSLALNLLLGGAIATHLLRAPAPPPTGERWRILAEGTAATMNEPDAGKFKAVLAAQTPGLEAGAAEVRKAREAVRQALRAEPFNPAALEQAMAEASARRLEMQKRYQAMIATAAAQVSPEGRTRIADWRPPDQARR